MTSNDFQILGKKIIVGIFIYLVPLFIIAGGLWFTNHLLKKDKERQTLQTPSAHENRN